MVAVVVEVIRSQLGFCGLADRKKEREKQRYTNDFAGEKSIRKEGYPSINV